MSYLWAMSQRPAGPVKRNRGFDIVWLTLAISLYIILFNNLSFWKAILKIYDAPTVGTIFFLLSVLCSLIAAANLILSIFGFKYAFKPIVILIVIIASFIDYFMDSYGIMMDKSMLQNILETDSREVYELFNIKFFSHLFLFGLVPSFLICWIKIRYRKFHKEVLLKLGIILTMAVFLGTNAFIFYKEYASLSRSHRYLRFLINPSYFAYSLSEYAQDLLNEGKKTMMPMGKDAAQTKPWQERGKKTITLLVLGETARAKNFSLNGYQRNTNPLLSKEDIINFSRFYSCGTTTSISLPCMFSHFGRNGYSESAAGQSENLLDVLSHAGITVLWRDNNSGCKGVCDRIQTQHMESFKNKDFCNVSGCYDEIMLNGLQEYVDKLETDAFIVLHQKGSHGPAYYLRYPEQFKVFTPVCESSQLNQCPRQDLANAYDNSILYTDYFLAQVIDFLKTNSDRFFTAMVYVSDHGESLGENNIYLHGIPYLFAPDEQKHVPFILWLSKEFEESYGIDRASVQKISSALYSHDNLFDSILGLLDIKTTEYNRRQDIFADAKRQ